jgi:hypothetical protein
MKEAAVLVLVSVVIVGGIGIWLANGGSLPFIGSQPAVQPASDVQPNDAQAEAAKKAEAAKALKKPAARAAKKTPSPPVAEAAPEPPLVVAPVAEVVVAPPPAPKQFPSANEISAGVERENISERFGQPALATTTTSDDGRVMETLVYARKSGHDVTVIRIEDGKVLSAYSR